METNLKFNSAICTSREQSERLLALGLKKETADMMYSVLVKDFRGKDVPNAEKIYSLCTWYKETSMSVGLEKREYIPAWSLHRLIEMMPTVITHNDYPLILGINPTCVYYAENEYVESFKNFEDNLYDCVVNCIEWLIKEGYFNKEYLEKKMKQYRKKPVIIEAIQFIDDIDRILEIQEFLGGETIRIDYKNKENPTLKINTLEGIMTASVGDYIIKGVQGEFYPCKPDIFEQTYEEIDNETIHK